MILKIAEDFKRVKFRRFYMQMAMLICIKINVYMPKNMLRIGPSWEERERRRLRLALVSQASIFSQAAVEERAKKILFQALKTTDRAQEF